MGIDFGGPFCGHDSREAQAEALAESWVNGNRSSVLDETVGDKAMDPPHASEVAALAALVALALSTDDAHDYARRLVARAAETAAEIEAGKRARLAEARGGSYRLTQREFRNLKSRLTRAQNSGDPEKVLAACEHAFGVFESKGYPDAWHRWNIARDDARLALQRKRAGL